MQTFAEAFADWTSIALQSAEADQDSFNRLSASLAQIERAAVLRPVQTLQDGLGRLTKKTDGGSEPTEATVALFPGARFQVFSPGKRTDRRRDQETTRWDLENWECATAQAKTR